MTKDLGSPLESAASCALSGNVSIKHPDFSFGIAARYKVPHIGTHMAANVILKTPTQGKIATTKPDTNEMDAATCLVRRCDTHRSRKDTAPSNVLLRIANPKTSLWLSQGGHDLPFFSTRMQPLNVRHCHMVCLASRNPQAPLHHRRGAVYAHEV